MKYKEQRIGSTHKRKFTVRTTAFMNIKVFHVLAGILLATTSWSTAQTPISIGQTLTSLSGYLDVQKHYIVNVPAGLDKLRITLLGSVQGGTGNCSLYVKEGAQASMSNWDQRSPMLSSGTEMTFHSPLAGNWYIMLYGAYSGWSLSVNADGSGGQPVAVSIKKDAFEPDDSRSAAKPITKGKKQYRSIHKAGNRDWAKFVVRGAGARHLRLETSGASGDTQMWLYRANGRLVAFDDDSGTGNFSRITRASLAAGTYYVLISENGNNETLSRYTLRVTWELASSLNIKLLSSPGWPFSTRLVSAPLFRPVFRGRVTDKNGKGVSGVRVGVRDPVRKMCAMLPARTDAKGEWSYRTDTILSEGQYAFDFMLVQDDRRMVSSIINTKVICRQLCNGINVCPRYLVPKGKPIVLKANDEEDFRYFLDNMKNWDTHMDVSKFVRGEKAWQLYTSGAWQRSGADQLLDGLNILVYGVEGAVCILGGVETAGLSCAPLVIHVANDASQSVIDSLYYNHIVDYSQYVLLNQARIGVVTITGVATTLAGNPTSLLGTAGQALSVVNSLINGTAQYYSYYTDSAGNQHPIFQAATAGGKVVKVAIGVGKIADLAQ